MEPVMNRLSAPRLTETVVRSLFNGLFASRPSVEIEWLPSSSNMVPKEVRNRGALLVINDLIFVQGRYRLLIGGIEIPIPSKEEVEIAVPVHVPERD